MKSSKFCRTTLIRILFAVALISSLLILPAFSQDTQDSQIFISGFNAYQQQNYSTAIDMMNEVLQKHPNSPLRDMALFWLARAHFKSGHRLEAARTMSQFNHEYPDNPLKSTIEEELIALSEAYDKGEKIATAPLAAAPAKKEQERIAAEKAATETAAVKGEQELVAAAEKARLEAERKEQERIAAEKAAAKAEAARLAAAQKEQERIAAEKAEKVRAEAEAAEKARLAAVKADQERAAAAAEKARLEAERKEQERIAAEKAAAKAEAARLAAAQKEQERIAAEKAEKVRAEAEAAEKARLAASKAEQERVAAAEKARLEAERKEQERIAAEKAAAKAEAARLAAAQKEQERIAAEKAEKVRAEAEAAEKARLATVKAEQERAAAAEKTRLETERKELERIAAEKAEKVRAEAEAADKARLATVKAEQERAATAEKTRQEAERKEQERIAAVKAEELRRKKQSEAEEKALSAKSQLREKAIAQYRSVIQTYPNTKSAAVAATRLKELGITVAQPQLPATSARQPGETGDNAQVLQLEVVQFAGFEFRLLSTPAAYNVGRSASLPFEVTNRGNASDSFRLESGFPAEFRAGFAAAEKPDQAITQTPLEPNETFKGVVNLTIPSTSIDGMRFSHPVKASSSFMPEATQSREIQVSAAAPFLRAVLKTDQTRPLPGDKLTYRIVVLNVGSTTASDVTVRLSYPPQMKPLDRGTTGFRSDATSVLLLEGLQVKSGERKELTAAFQLKDDSLAGQDLAVRAELIEVPLKKSSAFISNLANVDVRHGIKVGPGSEKLVIIPGETVNVPFTVTNSGNTRDTFNIAATVTGAGTSTIFHDLNRDGLRQANEPAITEIGPLEPKEEAAIVVEIRTSRDATDGSEGGVRLDFNPKGSATALAVGSTRLIYSRPVLQLAMSRSGGRLKPGEIASYDLTVVNRGSNLARVVELQSSWPEQLELVAAEPANSSAAAGTIHWKFKELGAGEKRTIKVSFRVKAGIGAGTSIQVRNSLNYEDLQGNRY